MEFIKKNITLIVGVSIPILMILFVAGSVYLPGLFIQPKYNFFYIGNDDFYSYDSQYSVQNEKLVVRDKIKEPVSRNRQPPRREVEFFIYDVAKNEGRKVSFKEAQNLNLNSNIKSPDGFEIVYGSREADVFPFFFFGSGSDRNTRYLKGHNVSKRLNLQPGFRFIGWIK